VGGYTEGKGAGVRLRGLVVGVPSPGSRKLTFVGKVARASPSRPIELLAALVKLERATSPFDAPLPARGPRDHLGVPQPVGRSATASGLRTATCVTGWRVADQMSRRRGPS